MDFSKYKTMEYYGWVKKSDSILNRFNRERIENAFGEEFTKRGISLAKEGEGDMIVTLFIVTEDKTQVTANTTGTGGYGGYYGYGPGYGWGGGHSTTTYNQYDYTVGTLLISAYDAKRKELIWEAAGTKTLDSSAKNPEKEINNVVQSIMYAYPVKPSK